MSTRTVVALAGATIILFALLLTGAAFWLAAHPSALLPLLSARLPPTLEISEVRGLTLGPGGGDIEHAAFRLDGNAVAVQELTWAWRIERIWPPRISPTSLHARSVDLRLPGDGAQPKSPRRPLPRFWETPYWPTIAALGLGIEQLRVSGATGETLLRGSIETGADTRSGRARLRLAATGGELQLQWQRSGDAEWLLDWQSDAPYPSEGRLALRTSLAGADWTLEATLPDLTIDEWRFERVVLQGSGTTDLFEGAAPLLQGRLEIDASSASEAGPVAWQCTAAIATQQDLGTVIELERLAARQGAARLSATPALKITLDAQRALQSVSLGEARVELREAAWDNWRIPELAVDFPAATLWSRNGESWVLPTARYRILAENAALEISLKSSGQIGETALRPDGSQSTRLKGGVQARYAEHSVSPLDYAVAVELASGTVATDGSLSAPGLGRLVSFRTRTELATGTSALQARVDSTSWNWGKGLLHALLGPKQSLVTGDLLDATLQFDIDAALRRGQWSARVDGAVDRASGLFRGVGVSGLAVSPFQLNYRDDALVSDRPLSWRIDALNAGITLSELRGELRLQDRAWRLLDIRGGLFGGTLSINELGRPDTEGPLGTVHLQGVDLARVVALLDNPDISVTGRISGEIPLYMEGGAVTVHDGRLQSSDGGTIRYRPQAAAADASPANAQIALVRDALSNLVFDSLTAGVEYAASGDLVLKTEIRGRNPELDRTRPVHLNLTVEDNILTLMRSLRAGDRITEWLGRRIEERKR